MPTAEFGRLPERCRSVAVLIQQGRWREGLEQFQALAPAIQAGCGELPALAARRGLKLDEIQLNDLPLAALLKSLQGILVEVNGAVRKRDWTTVADLIEEDLVAAIEAVNAVLVELSRPA